MRRAAALSRRRERERTGRYLVEGPHAVAEAIAAGVVDEVFATADAAALLDASGVRVSVADADVIRRLASSVHPQGVVAVAHRRHHDLDDVLGDGFAVALCGVSDPGNAGSAIRSAAAAGASGVVLTVGSVDPYNAKAVRASAGAVTRLPVVTDIEVEAFVRACRDAGQRMIAFDAHGAIDLTTPGIVAHPCALVFGSEAHGLPAAVRDGADAVVAITLHGPAESLNLGAAVAIASYAAAGARAGRRV